MSLRRSNGFTLVELVVTIAVLAILVTTAFPAFQSLIRSNRVSAGHNELIGLVNLARSDAVRNNQGGGVCGSSNGTSCDGNWSAGMLAFSDASSNSATSGNGQFDTGETVLRFTQVSPGMVATGPQALIAFDARGRRRAAGDQAITLRPEKCGKDPLMSTVTINASGQASSSKGPCP
ncbi:type IV fimbrial biogenesis protein FimT [Stenotrophomonas sp. 1278]|jgi:type IV fimbrial biogenesis protein FimT|uniref:GspH/FimT family pseudopilin n=1 Tax=Stenotrophomonas sp. 1278 TaxID=2940566 RepID=UPI002473DB22|nr:GspH/FimT family pseudopilin [Stenotrophomonas sp. 1278]MDH6330810.1 type IV fimbrial biogenesis protein FimT [Stenotrophomonas sp. 1278]